MTRQEAMEALSVLKIYDAQWLREAVDMAIEALEQEETLQNLTKPNKSDLISRQAAIDAVMGFMPSLTTPDGCGQFDREIFEAQEMFVDIGQALNKLPSAQPFTAEQIQTMQELEFAQVEKAYELGKADRPKWIPCSERMPETDNTNEINEFDVLLVVRPKKHPERTPQVYIGKLRPVEGDDGSGNFWGVKTAPCEWTIWGWSYFQEPEVLAWMPLPEAYREDGEEE